MKTSLKIFLLAVALIVMNGCSAQKRAERHVRKAVSLCPELVQTKAHPIDTVLTVSGFADCARLKLASIDEGETVYHATDHGTFVVRRNAADTTISIGFIATPQQIRLTDTVRFAPVVITPQPHESVTDGAREFAVGFLCFLAGVAAALYLLFRQHKN